MATEAPDLTIDELALQAGTTSRRIRSLQTLGLVPHPDLRGRTGVYGPVHRDRLTAVLRLQDRGFSLESIGDLLGAFDRGDSLSDVLGLTAEGAGPGRRRRAAEAPTDTAELYWFASMEDNAPADGRRPRPLLSLVPTTMWEHDQAS
jgi:DNA-binding transcriptional MerR regulator